MCSLFLVDDAIIVEGRDKVKPYDHHLWKYSRKTGTIESLAKVFNIGMVDLLGGFSGTFLIDINRWLINLLQDMHACPLVCLSVSLFRLPV